MPKSKIPTNAKRIWDKARYCYCLTEDCNPNNHRLCGTCGGKMFYGSYEGTASQNNSRYAWNIDHIVPKSRGGSDLENNLQAVHLRCNRNNNG